MTKLKHASDYYSEREREWHSFSAVLNTHQASTSLKNASDNQENVDWPKDILLPRSKNIPSNQYF